MLKGNRSNTADYIYIKYTDLAVLCKVIIQQVFALVFLS